MKLIITIGFFLLCLVNANAQDIIKFRDGDTITAKVTEVGIIEIKYFKADKLQGPLYITNKADVAFIFYANGSKDQFDTPQKSNKANVLKQKRTSNAKGRVRRPYFIPIFVPQFSIGHPFRARHHWSHH